MEKRLLGRTGHMSSIVIFGSAAFWEIDQETAGQALDMALEAGINHIDVAPQYGLAEARVGAWLEPHRDKFFLGCKTLERSREAAQQELARSLKKLRTQTLDLYQLHAVGTFEELDAAFSPGGAIEALKEAREKGLTRFLGITGHGLQTPAVFLKALELFDFDTVMFPLNPVLFANLDYRKSAEQLLAVCAEKNVGVMVIKSVAKGPWGDQQKRYQTWYEPYDVQDKVTNGVRFALSQHPVTGIASAGDVHVLPMVIKAAKEFRAMSVNEQEALVIEAETLEPLFT